MYGPARAIIPAVKRNTPAAIIAPANIYSPQWVPFCRLKLAPMIDLPVSDAMLMQINKTLWRTPILVRSGEIWLSRAVYQPDGGHGMTSKLFL